MRRVAGLIIIGFLLYYFMYIVVTTPFGTALHGVSEHYVERGIVENRGANLVTSIVVNYRGFDTLGEVTVLFLASTALSFLLSFMGCKQECGKEESSEILKTVTYIVFPLTILFGVYIFIHGHLTPGGGFQGGAVIASGFMLMFMAYRKYHISHYNLTITESLSGIAFVIIGLLGLWFGGSFLANRVIPLGEWNTLFSAGVIPLIYIAIGFKVGSELSAVISDLIHTVREEE